MQSPTWIKYFIRERRKLCECYVTIIHIQQDDKMLQLLLWVSTQNRDYLTTATAIKIWESWEEKVNNKQRDPLTGLFYYFVWKSNSILLTHTYHWHMNVEGQRKEQETQIYPSSHHWNTEMGSKEQTTRRYLILTQVGFSHLVLSSDLEM